MSFDTQNFGSSGGASSGKVKVSVTDTTADFLSAKLLAGTGISLTQGNSGANETLTIAEVPPGSDTQMLFNDNGVTGAASGQTYNKTTQRTGFQVPASSTEATIHADTTTGETITPPSSGTYVLTLDPAIDSPASASATLVTSPIAPSAPTINFTYIDTVADAGQFTTQNTMESGFIANGQTITYTVIAYRLVGTVRVTNTSSLTMTPFTDTINDGSTPFGMDIGGWGTANGYQDGFLLMRADDTGTFIKDIGNVTTYTDTHFTDTDTYVNTPYYATGSSWSGNLAEYKNLGGTPYRSVYTNGNNTDSGIAGTALIINATFTTSAFSGQYYLSHSNQYFDVGYTTSFDDYGQTGGSDIATFASVAFPYFDTSTLSGASGSGQNLDYSTGNYVADGSTWTINTWAYQTNPIDNSHWFVSMPDTSAGGSPDDNSGNPLQINYSFTPGSASGYVVEILKNGAVIGSEDVGGASTGTISPITTVPTTPALSSYTGLAWSWSDYGYVTSPAIKYSATPITYTNSDNNPTDGFVWLHQQSTFGNSTNIKIIETAPRAPGNFYSSINATSVYQTYTSLGDATVTPSTLGFQAVGQTRNYDVYSEKTINGVLIYSATAYRIPVVFPNNSLFYTITPLSWGAVSGISTYKIKNITDNNYKEITGTSFNIDTATSWGSSGTLTPTAAYRTVEILDYDSTKYTGGKPLTIRDTYNRGGLLDAHIEFQYSGGGGSFGMAAWYGYKSNGNAFIDSYNNGLDISTHTRLGGSSQGTIFNLLGSPNQPVVIKGQTYAYLGYFNPNVDTTFFGSNTMTYGDPNATVAIRDNGSDKALTIESNNNNASSILFSITNNAGATNYLAGFLRNGGAFFKRNGANNAVLSLGAGDSTTTQIALDSTGTLPSSPVLGGFERYDNSGWSPVAITSQLLWTDKNGNRGQFQFGLGSSTSGNWWYSDSNGMAKSDNKITWNGSYINTNPTWLFQAGLSVSSGQSITMTGGGILGLTGSSIGGNPRFPYIAKTANYTIAATDQTVNATSNTFNLTLPTAVSISGRANYLHNSGTGVSTILNTSSQTINGQASGTITLSQNKGIWVISDGANYISPGCLATAIVGTVANTQLANSTISGVALGGTLANLTATDTTLTFSGTYTGATARTIGLNLGNVNTWTGKQSFGTPVNLKNYTVATLPTGVRGDIAYVTDALAPTFLATIVGGGTVVTPVFYNGTNWVGY